MRFIKIFLFTLGLLLCFQAGAKSIKPFKADYTVQYKGMHVANGTHSLIIDQSGHYLFKSTTSSTIPVFKFKIYETSQGQWTTSGPHPDQYTYNHKGIKKQRNLVSKFDWKRHINFTQKNEDHYQVSIPDNSHDKISYQLALRQDLIQGKKTFAYHIADKKRLATYVFKQVAKETLKTPIGKIETIRMERTNTNPKKEQIIIWLAPKHDYLLVKIIGIKKGQIVAKADIKRIL